MNRIKFISEIYNVTTTKEINFEEDDTMHLDEILDEFLLFLKASEFPLSKKELLNELIERIDD